MADAKGILDDAKWDQIDRFYSADAAALWFELDGRDPVVKALAGQIEQRFKGNATQGMFVTRHELTEFAKEKGVRPPFLFPEERKREDGEPDPRHKKTLLHIIAALLDLADIDPSESPKTTAHAINAKLELRGAPMKADTIAQVIRDARELGND